MNAIAQFLEDILGSSQKGSGSNYKFCCPFDECKGKDSNNRGDKKFEIDTSITEVDGRQINKWACWVCGSKGTTVYSLLRKLKVGQNIFNELNTVIKYSEVTKRSDIQNVYAKVILPSEYKSLLGTFNKSDLELRHAKVYLKKRKVTEDDIIKYSIGFCDSGEYRGRIVIPIFDKNGNINYFVARSISEDVFPKYKYPNVSRDIVPNEFFINENEPIIICEGIFDAIAIKRNVIPLLGKEIQETLMIKLIKAPNKKVYMALDPDAVKQMIKYSEQFIAAGKQVFTVDFKGFKDANEMGFKAFTESIQSAKRITQSDILKLKLNRI